MVQESRIMNVYLMSLIDISDIMSHGVGSYGILIGASSYPDELLATT